MSTTLDANAVKEVAELARRAQRADTPIISDSHGREFAQVSLTPIDAIRPPEAPEPGVLVVHTLQAVVDYINANHDQLALDRMILHIVGPGTVQLLGPLFGLHQQRFHYLTASAPDRLAHNGINFSFGRYVEQQVMVVALLSLFVQDDNCQRVRALISNLRLEGSIQSVDAGRTQEVTTKRGFSMVENIELPNPVHLAPFRTFAEIDQPASPFILRARGSEDKPFEGALYEADGGAWMLEAIGGIRAFFDEADLGVTVVG